MKVDVLHAPGCAKCLGELDALRAAARRADPAVEWKELDILQALDYAVELGVLRPSPFKVFIFKPSPARGQSTHENGQWPR